MKPTIWCILFTNGAITIVWGKRSLAYTPCGQHLTCSFNNSLPEVQQNIDIVAVQLWTRARPYHTNRPQIHCCPWTSISPVDAFGIKALRFQQRSITVLWYFPTSCCNRIFRAQQTTTLLIWRWSSWSPLLPSWPFGPSLFAVPFHKWMHLSKIHLS